MDRFESSQQPTPAKPSIIAALFSWAIWPTWANGLVLFASMWMIQCEGCNSEDVYPIDHFSKLPLKNALVMNLPYLYGAYLFGVMVLICLFRTEWSLRLYRLLTQLIGAILILFYLFEDLTTAWAAWWIGMLQRIPLYFFFLYPFVALFRNRDWKIFTTRINARISLAAALWICLGVIFSHTLYVGFWISQLASLALLPSAWMFYFRAEHDVIDSNAKPIAWRFSMKKLLLWSCIIPILFTYYCWVGYLERQMSAKSQQVNTKK